MEIKLVQVNRKIIVLVYTMTLINCRVILRTDLADLVSVWRGVLLCLELEDKLCSFKLTAHLVRSGIWEFMNGKYLVNVMWVITVTSEFQDCTDEPMPIHVL